jgi:conjugal transfer pilus assembly protein TraF
MIRTPFIAFAALLASNAVAAAADQARQEKQGYWWYEDPAPALADESRPEIPSGPALEALKPSAIQALIDAQLDYALVAQTPAAVADYYRLVDLSRRRSRGFAALTNVVLLENPELNARSAYPITNAGRDALTRRREEERTSRLVAERGEFALIMFSSQRCGFCGPQWSVVQLFADKNGWLVHNIDIDAEPQKAARFGVEGTPMTVMIRKDTPQWFTVGVGTDSYPALADNVYRAIRLLKGEIDERQFFNGAGDDGGFFDPAHRAQAYQKTE